MTWLGDLEERASASLDWYVRDYFAASAGTPADYARALAEWDAVRFRPRALRGPKSLEVSTTVLGQAVRTPILIAPMAQQVAAHPRGEAEMADAAARVGTLLGVSTNTGVRFADIASAGAPWWFQLYLFHDPATTRAILERAVAAGASAIVLTVDTTALVASRPGMEPTEWPDVPGKARLVNITDARREAEQRHPGSRAPSLDDIRWVADLTGLPVVVKGILRADDAAAAVDAGARAVVVSTHGARRMGQSVSSLAALPEVVEAVGDRAEVYLDSGIRSGSHVLAALALGARAVFVGRPAMWGLVTGGADGAAHVLERLTAELVLALDQSGATGLADLGPDLLAR